MLNANPERKTSNDRRYVFRVQRSALGVKRKTILIARKLQADFIHY